MKKALSLSIGLNTIDDNKYKGRYGPLRNAENDTDFYFDLATKKNFDAIKLVGKEATSNNLLDSLKDFALRLNEGDLCFISYSGHGTRVPDLNDDESDKYDEALVLYDRLFIDDEFQLCWAKFKPGVKILFINDSCYNGTVSRFLEINRTAADLIWPDHILRGVDAGEASIDFEDNISYYKSIKLSSPLVAASCSIIHIGACQDNQLADDGGTLEKNGKFTTAVRDTLWTDNFQGSTRAFFETVKNKMPPWQTPNWDIDAGQRDAEFEKANFLQL